jgi:hypothetical protein
MIDILNGTAKDQPLPPVPLFILVSRDHTPLPFRFSMLNGVHRYYASIAAGFAELPATPRSFLRARLSTPA